MGQCCANVGTRLVIRVPEWALNELFSYLDAYLSYLVVHPSLPYILKFHDHFSESDTNDEESGEPMLRTSTTVSPISVAAGERSLEGDNGTPPAVRAGIDSAWHTLDQETTDTSKWNLASQVHLTASAVVTWSSPCRQQHLHAPQSYVLQYNIVGEPESSAINVTVSGVNVVLLQNLEANQQYSYRVVGVYADGTQTSWSSTATFHTNYTHTQSSYSLG